MASLLHHQVIVFCRTVHSILHLCDFYPLITLMSSKQHRHTLFLLLQHPCEYLGTVVSSLKPPRFRMRWLLVPSSLGPFIFWRLCLVSALSVLVSVIRWDNQDYPHTSNAWRANPPWMRLGGLILPKSENYLTINIGQNYVGFYSTCVLSWT